MSIDFIIIDNNHLNCFVVEKMLQNIDKGIKFESFIHAHEAYDHIKQTQAVPGSRAVILLDIHMPLMDGFEFLDEFGKLPQETRKHYFIYIITSSTDINDKTRSSKSIFVKQFISKPITFNIIKDIIAEVDTAIV